MHWMLTTPFVTQIPLPYMAWWHLGNGIMGYWGEAMLKSNFWRKRLMWRPCVLYCDFCPHSASVASLNQNSWWVLKETEQLVGETLLFFSCEINEAAMKTSDLVYCAFLLGGLDLLQTNMELIRKTNYNFCVLLSLNVGYIIIDSNEG